MRSFKQLVDPKTGIQISINSKTLVFKLVCEDRHQEIRLKPAYAQILSVLFAEHPGHATYDAITHILKQNQLVCPDETRLHRKVSELRGFLVKFHPCLSGLITNTRGVGYGLPLHFIEPQANAVIGHPKIHNPILQHALDCFGAFASQSIELSKQCSLIRVDDVWLLQRKPVHANLERLCDDYEMQKKKIFAELRLHPADFSSIRLEFLLAKLKTYLGLARVSEFSITKNQWLAWHEAEVKQSLHELIQLIKQAE